jgi:hypothetical protein
MGRRGGGRAGVRIGLVRKVTGGERFAREFGGEQDGY